MKRHLCIVIPNSVMHIANTTVGSREQAMLLCCVSNSSLECSGVEWSPVKCSAMQCFAMYVVQIGGVRWDGIGCVGVTHARETKRDHDDAM